MTGPEELTWLKFKERVTSAVQRKSVFYFRGHANSDWNLRTTFHRESTGGTRPTLKRYIEDIIPELNYQVCAITNEVLDVANMDDLGILLGLLRHHGFPTPLLDWTQSPFIASFFAYKDVNTRNAATDFVKIYVFDPSSWNERKLTREDLLSKEPCLGVFKPYPRFNPRIIPQQGSTTITNQDDIEGYIDKKGGHLQRILLPVKDRPTVMRELELMGISEMSLFPGLDGLCRSLKEKYF